jgi:hypothetical protein
MGLSQCQANAHPIKTQRSYLGLLIDSLFFIECHPHKQQATKFQFNIDSPLCCSISQMLLNLVIPTHINITNTTENENENENDI